MSKASKSKLDRIVERESEVFPSGNGNVLFYLRGNTEKKVITVTVKGGMGDIVTLLVVTAIENALFADALKSAVAILNSVSVPATEEKPKKEKKGKK